jgi:formate dehydrogenase major subunit
MSNMVTLTIDGQQVTAEAGQTVLEAAQQAGIHIPTLCHHPALAPVGACRLCLIEISKFQPLYPACAYQVVEGLKVETRSERVEKARRFVLELLFSERNHYCMYCEMSGNCELQDLGYEYGLDHWVYPTYTQRFPVDASREAFIMDHNRCVLCRRCVRACDELVANHTLGMRQRGARTMISADLDVPFGDSSCISCGTCLQVCPTGALIDKRSAFMGVGRNVELERVKSVCSQCSVGCGIEIVTRGGNVLRIDGDWDAAPNRGVLCEKGRFAPLQDGRPRITSPLRMVSSACWRPRSRATKRSTY